jgi:hypothetical protein
VLRCRVEREFAGDDANKRCETQRELSVGGSFLWDFVNRHFLVDAAPTVTLLIFG